MSNAAYGEHRRKLEQLARDLIDKGLLVEAGFVSMRALAIPPTAPRTQVENMRMAFFAGAQHVFGSLLQALDPGEEPTAEDERRMACIARELQTFIDVFAAQHMPTKGKA